MLVGVKGGVRQSNFELLRIAAMLMIIASHVAQHAGAGNWQILHRPFSMNSVWAYLLGTHGQLGVCLFVFISSWFLCAAEGIHIKKLLLIHAECLLYAGLIFCLLKGAGLESLGPKHLVKVLLAPWLGGYWFVQAYICFYLCVPALQFYSKNVPHAAQGKLLLVLTVLIPCLQAFCDQFVFGTAGSFIYLYLLCSYLRGREQNFVERHCVPLFLLGLAFVTGGSFALCISGGGIR